jgi:hypothetical protein
MEEKLLATGKTKFSGMTVPHEMCLLVVCYTMLNSDSLKEKTCYAIAAF